MRDDLPDLLHPCVVVMMVVVVMMLVIVIMVMMVFVIVVMAMMVFMIVVMLMMMLVIVLTMIMGLVVLVQMSVQIVHVVIMAVVRFVQYDVEVTTIDSSLFHSADLCFKPVSGDSLQHLQELVLVCAQVQECRDGHIAANTCSTFQI
jgi:hypothetical protein